MARWRTQTCGSCSGYGVVSDYRGGDFNGAMDCPSCWGGVVYVSENDRMAAYPGGPFLGHAPGLFAECDAATEFDPREGEDDGREDEAAAVRSDRSAG